MINYKYSPKHQWVDDLGRPWRINDVGMNSFKDYIFVINEIVDTGARISWWRGYKTESPIPHCSSCSRGSCDTTLLLYNYGTLTARTDLFWLIKPKKTILILNKEQYA